MELSPKNGLAAAVAAGLSLWAAQASAGGFVGFGIGESTAEASAECGDFDPDGIVCAQPDDQLDFDESDTAYSVFAGWMFNDYIGAEIGYRDFGEPNGGVSFDGVEGGTATGEVEAEVTGFTAALLGQLPLGPVDVYAKVGFISYDAELQGVVTYLGEVFSATLDDDGEELLYGVGALLNLGPVGVGVEYEMYDVDFDDLNILSLRAQLNF
jgi:hypothetical protein